MFDAEQHAEPDQVDAELVATGASSGTTMKAISKKSRKKASKKTNRLTKIRKPS